LSNRKVSQLTGFHPNGGKTCLLFALSVWAVIKKAIAELKIRQEVLWSIKLKIRKNRETFLSLKFAANVMAFIITLKAKFIHNCASITPRNHLRINPLSIMLIIIL